MASRFFSKNQNEPSALFQHLQVFCPIWFKGVRKCNRQKILTSDYGKRNAHLFQKPINQKSYLSN